ncbi:MAG: heme lyase CcmF/NrfE family subunit, partial [Candidatus Bipolaricaulia bacterium]
PHLPVVAAIIGGVQVFFTFIMTFVSSSFATLDFRPMDGAGLNPLLQNVGMIFHPPTQYLGYVGFTVPFAFAMAALIHRRADAEWIRRTRSWTIASWLFLTMGMVIGGQWAYVELGWGGYWAWDPVENASFIPWLTATAFLHSVMIQQAKGMLKTWNLSLIALTFFFTIFGTFLTRSGVIQSVHAFGESTLGLWFLLFMALVAGFAGYLILDRARLLRSEGSFEGLLAKESSFLVNNVLFLGLAFATFWGTIFPLISEAVTGNKVTVGPPFFNQVNGPIFLGVIILMGICPLIAWRRSSLAKLACNLLVPVGLGLAAFIAFLLHLGRPAVALAYGSAIFVATGILYDLIREAKVRRDYHPKEWPLRLVWNLMRSRARKYGGYIVHLGVILMAVGIVTSSAFKLETTVQLTPGETTDFAGFSLQYNGIDFIDAPGKVIAQGRLLVTRAGQGGSTERWEIRPTKVFHAQMEQPHTDVDILKLGFDDLYAILAGYKVDGEGDGDGEDFATFKLFYHPGINLIWLGFYVILIGGSFALVGPLRWRRRRKGGRG